MDSRAFNKRIEIWETIVDSIDEFGNAIFSEVLIGNSWAKIATFNVGKNNNVNDFGLDDVRDSLTLTVRKRNDITYNSQTQFVKYRGEKYLITTSPINVNFEDNIIQFIVTKASSTVKND